MIRRTHAPDAYAMFTRMLLDAIGVGTAALLAGCGGDVVVDEEASQSGGTTGSGGSGSSSSAASSGSTTASSTVASSSSGNQPFTCSDPNANTYACIGHAIEGCPAAGDPGVINALGQQLNTSGPCPDDPEFCWCETSVNSVPCGPDWNVTDDCCYLAVVTTEELCMGRPLLVDGETRVATITDGRGWSQSGSRDEHEALQPGLRGLDASLRAHLAAEWSSDALFEHASVASFARFALELMSLAAPADLVRDAQRAMGEEIRHAELCFALASAFAGAPIGPGPLALDRVLQQRSLAELAVAVVREGCIGETVAALVAAASRDQATDPAVRAALDEIADDEASHAALAWRTVAWACERGGAPVRRAVEAAFFETAPSVVADEPELGESAVLQSFGRLSASVRRDVAARALAEVVRPCARALLRSTPLETERYIGGEAP